MKVAQALPWLQSQWQTLSQQLSSQRLGHAVLLTGQQGVGKRVFLKEFAQLVLCHQGEQQTPCGECASCRLFTAGNHPDFITVEPEETGKAIKIDQIRRVTDFVNTTASQGQRKVVLLGPAEVMNINASNALLKSLEEPSSQVTMLLYSHQPSRLLATIKSRCQQYSAPTPKFQDGLMWLQQNSQESGLDSLLRLAQGAPLKVIEMIEQDVHVQYMQFCQDMQDLANHSVVWQGVVSKWKNWSVEYLLDWFYGLLLDVQRCKSGVQDRLIPELNMQTELVSKRMSVAEADGILSAIYESKKAVVSGSNPNPTLLIERLLVDWLGQLRQS
ncbi:DNA polymerase III subunit delta' [Bermanella marisrubri]|uniref:DNA polymerase III subunit delta' n=1 Tax=Bermanella marisrubri TaxID=207949 RepID=Q1N4U3_9GAMM|nr:DNA polymerase III subunit delta' [Bermanella marisrubri]EAT13335.1 DNA polymerase III subunit delta [Oceanobacter sp. RED65] [Bermanella marisrubri]QIZ84094.1 DNA polymerase III subunit delta' [Bermanella marisrubri]